MENYFPIIIHHCLSHYPFHFLLFLNQRQKHMSVQVAQVCCENGQCNIAKTYGVSVVDMNEIVKQK